MSQPIQVHSRVDKDGILTLRVPLTPRDANAEVLVTIERVNDTRANGDWHEFIAATYGSCAGMGLARHDQGAVEEREAME